MALESHRLVDAPHARESLPVPITRHLAEQTFIRANVGDAELQQVFRQKILERLSTLTQRYQLKSADINQVLNRIATANTLPQMITALGATAVQFPVNDQILTFNLNFNFSWWTDLSAAQVIETFRGEHPLSPATYPGNIPLNPATPYPNLSALLSQHAGDANVWQVVGNNPVFQTYLLLREAMGEVGHEMFDPVDRNLDLWRSSLFSTEEYLRKTGDQTIPVGGNIYQLNLGTNFAEWAKINLDSLQDLLSAPATTLITPPLPADQWDNFKNTPLYRDLINQIPLMRNFKASLYNHLTPQPPLSAENPLDRALLAELATHEKPYEVWDKITKTPEEIKKEQKKQKDQKVAKLTAQKNKDEEDYLTLQKITKLTITILDQLDQYKSAPTEEDKRNIVKGYRDSLIELNTYSAKNRKCRQLIKNIISQDITAAAPAPAAAAAPIDNVIKKFKKNYAKITTDISIKLGRINKLDQKLAQATAAATDAAIDAEVKKTVTDQIYHLPPGQHSSQTILEHLLRYRFHTTNPLLSNAEVEALARDEVRRLAFPRPPARTKLLNEKTVAPNNQLWAKFLNKDPEATKRSLIGSFMAPAASVLSDLINYQFGETPPAPPASPTDEQRLVHLKRMNKYELTRQRHAQAITKAFSKISPLTDDADITRALDTVSAHNGWSDNFDKLPATPLETALRLNETNTSAIKRLKQKRLLIGRYRAVLAAILNGQKLEVRGTSSQIAQLEALVKKLEDYETRLWEQYLTILRERGSQVPEDFQKTADAEEITWQNDLQDWANDADKSETLRRQIVKEKLRRRWSLPAIAAFSKRRIKHLPKDIVTTAQLIAKGAVGLGIGVKYAAIGLAKGVKYTGLGIGKVGQYTGKGILATGRGVKRAGQFGFRTVGNLFIAGHNVLFGTLGVATYLPRWAYNKAANVAWRGKDKKQNAKVFLNTQPFLRASK